MRNKNKKTGLGILEVLQIIFIVLKLCKLINWSWLAVLSPSWISFLIIAIVIIVVWILEQ